MLRALACLALAATSCPALFGQEAKLKYPATKKVEQSDTYHGTAVADPYRWLEDDVRKSTDVADWVAEQNKVTDAYLAKLPERDAIKKRITELWNYEKISAPSKTGGKYFFSRTTACRTRTSCTFRTRSTPCRGCSSTRTR